MFQLDIPIELLEMLGLKIHYIHGISLVFGSSKSKIFFEKNHKQFGAEKWGWDSRGWKSRGWKSAAEKAKAQKAAKARNPEIFHTFCVKPMQQNFPSKFDSVYGAFKKWWND